MRPTSVIVACMLALSGAGAAFAQGVEPLKVLEKERRDRLETDQRIAREAQARRLKERADQAAKADAGRKLDQEVAAPAMSSPAPDTEAALPAAPPTDTPGVGVAPAAQPLSPPGGKTDTGTPPSPPTRVLITVDKAAQRMFVAVGGKQRYSWPVSTGRAAFETPAGTFRPLRLAREHYSKEWDDAPMPHSIFFTSRGHAIHGSNDIRRLGRRASHGCV